MSLIKREQIAGMNIHYMRYSLDYFLDAQVKAGIKSIEFWAGDYRLKVFRKPGRS